MKKIVLALLIVGRFAGLAGSASADETKKSKPIAVKGRLAMMATVEAIDTANRTLTVRGPNGKQTLPVDDRVARFGQIKVGDRISAQYYESVVFDIERADPRAAADAAAAKNVLTAIVWAVDPDTPAVTVKIGDAAAQNFRVRSKKYVRDLNVGEQVVITLTDALIVGVEPAK